MSNRRDKKYAWLMAMRIIKFHGWRKGVSWWRRRKVRRILYLSILQDLESMTRNLEIMFTPGWSYGLTKLLLCQEDHEFNVE